MMSHYKQDLPQRIEKALDSIRPYLNIDGGNVEIAGISDDMILKLKFIGNCESCKMRYITMRVGIEEAIIKAVPEIKGVEAINIDEG